MENQEVTNEQVVEKMMIKLKELESESDRLTASIEEKRKKILQKMQNLNLSIGLFSTKKREE